MDDPEVVVNIPEAVAGPIDSYNPSNWYWVIGEDNENVFSSSTGKTVSVEDTDYQEWKKKNKYPSRIASWEELREVLQQQAPDVLTRVDQVSNRPSNKRGRDSDRG
jgi:hypothetical protein